MDFTMKKPCKDCPFRRDVPAYLNGPRCQEIIRSITSQDGQFPCHKTTVHDGDGDYVPQFKGEQHCAGAMILLEKLDQPNQIMRIAERVGSYHRDELDMEAPVFDTAEEFIRHHAEWDEDYEPECCEVVDGDCLAPAGWMEGGEVVHNYAPDGEVTGCPNCGTMTCENCSCYCEED